MPTPRGGINGIAVNGCFYTWGGEGNRNSSSGLFEQVEVYNTLTDTWVRLDPMPVLVHGVTGAAFINGLIYLPGAVLHRAEAADPQSIRYFNPLNSVASASLSLPIFSLLNQKRVCLTA